MYSIMHEIGEVRTMMEWIHEMGSLCFANIDDAYTVKNNLPQRSGHILIMFKEFKKVSNRQDNPQTE